MNALCNEFGNNGNNIITAVINSAIVYEAIPRALDKVMYIGCSGNLPLLGIDFNRAVSKSMKDQFIKMLEDHNPCSERVF